MATGWPPVFSMSITPFTDDGRLDEGLLRAHLQYMAAGGVGIYLCSQGSGEGDLLTPREKLRMYEIGAEELKGKSAIHAAGIGLSHSTDEILALAKGAAAAGVDAIYLLGPRTGAVPVRADELDAYYRTMLEAIPCDVVISSNASLMGYGLAPPLVEKLVREYEHVKGLLIADNVGPMVTQVARYRASLGNRVEIRIGMTQLALTAHALGADGLLCFEPNIAPRLCAGVWEALASGDGHALIDRFALLLRLNLACSRYGNPRSLKDGMTALGLNGGALRHPYLHLSKEEQAELKADLEALNLGAIESFG
jgi:4-hydroxy-tetrahydrodipicolinate synthase